MVRKASLLSGIRRRFHLTISGCLGPCPLANVILVFFSGRSAWFHSINAPEDVTLLYDYVERMLLAERYLDPPSELAGRLFERYVTGSAAEETGLEGAAGGCLQEEQSLPHAETLGQAEPSAIRRPGMCFPSQ